MSATEPLQFASEDVLLLFAGGVVETFHSAYDRSFRTPAAWIGVRVQPAKHERVSFSIGRTDPTQPVYGPEVNLSWDDVKFELAAAEEPNMRAFFAQVAQTAGRAP